MPRTSLSTSVLRETQVLPVAMFLGSFAWSFVYVSLPFHIQRVSTWDAVSTLRWTGWILGISPLATVATAPFWGRFAGRGNPRTFFVATQYFQGAAFLGMALARTLPEMFLARLVLGFMGAASTFAFISAGRAGGPSEVRRQIAAMQSAMTVGQVIGPLCGAIAAARIGFRESFVLGGVVLFACGLLVSRSGMTESAPTAPREAPARRAYWRETILVSLLVLGASTQIFFLTSILPQVMAELGVPPERTLEIGGMIIFASGAAAALGSLAAPRLAEVLPERRLVATLLVVSSLSVAALAAAHGVWGYGALRFLQVLCLAPVFPIVVARIAHTAGGEAIGIINAARIGASFVGPVLATSLLASGSSTVLYVALTLIGLACVPLSALRAHVPAAGR
jgi:MFS transporter, DHA1 family, multidrug resistance protein